jgi:hypothetical protein
MSYTTLPVVTHCVGRHTISMPVPFQKGSIVTGIFKLPGAHPQDPGFQVLVNEGEFSKADYIKKINERRNELQIKKFSGVDIFQLEKSIEEESTIFRVQRLEDAYMSEIIFMRGKSIVTINLKSFHDRYLAAEKSLIEFSKIFKEFNSDSSSKNERGFCLGSVVVVGSFKDESGSFIFKNGENSDIEVEVDTYSPNESKTLLDRMSGPDSLINIFDINHKVLRKGERNVANMRSQEWLGWAKLSEEPDAKSFQFTLETMRQQPSETAPKLNVTFNTGKDLPGGGMAKTTMSDEEAMRMWDDMINSIRPTSF